MTVSSWGKRIKALLKPENILLFIIFLVGVVVRSYEFSSIPAGLNQDEAYAAYEAHSLLNYGVDSFGYAFPCYFISWGSGMNALESYLAIPFMAIFGSHVWAFRLPQLILSCVDIIVIYLLLKQLFSKRTAFVGFCLLAVCPWHIIMSRWGLESNLAPHFLLYGLYFMMRSRDNDNYLIPAAIMYGTTLYSYATTWITVPLTVALCGLYLLATGVKYRKSILAMAFGTLFVLALPLMLFVLVNNGIIPEIKTAMFSVPRLMASRAGEISFANIFSEEKLMYLKRIFVKQNDYAIWNSSEDYGLFYQFTTPLMFIGIVYSLGRGLWDVYKKRFSPYLVVIIAAACAFFTVLLLKSLNVNRTNVCHMYSQIFIILALDGVFAAFDLLKNKPWRQLFKTVATLAITSVYLLSFVSFTDYYFTEFPDKIAKEFLSGMPQAIERAKELSNEETIGVDLDIPFSLVLWYDKTPAPRFTETVVYNHYPSAFMNVNRYDGYKFSGYSKSNKYDDDTVHVFIWSKAKNFEVRGFTVEQYENIGVAWKE
ncbi:MAG: hypothetical protein E7312_08910 [Clostridiales bacterium]|nr:hypothetical protein [Clostridiales bacterium]